MSAEGASPAKRVKTSALPCYMREGSAPEQRIVDGVAYPFVMLATSEGAEASVAQVQAWVSENQAFLEEKLRAHGAVLFRGLGCLRKDIDFDTFVKGFIGCARLPPTLLRNRHSFRAPPPPHCCRAV